MTRPIRASETDACPGALRLHAAADGPLARVRLPGGMLTGAQLSSLAEIAEEWGDGGLELTSRANVQLRALNGADPAQLAARLHAAGLLPSETHETVRNIAAPPLASATLRALVQSLDQALCADPALAALPGRFLFAIGDVPLIADIAALAQTAARPHAAAPSPALSDTAARPDGSPSPFADDFAIVFAGRDVGLRVPADRVVEALLAGAHAFLAARAAAGVTAWRLAEIPDGPRRIATDVAAALRLPCTEPEKYEIPQQRSLVGVVEQGGGLVAAGAIVPLGRLTGVQMKVLSDAPRLALTASRGVVIPDLSPEAAGSWLGALADAGLAVEADSRWSGVTACAGRPGCAKSLADVRADALATTRFDEGLPVHWVGCPRGCGSPSVAHVRVEATPPGYAVVRAGGSAGPGDEAGAARPERDISTHRRLAEIITSARRG
ncbi:precorrin-3B synthase [Actinoplanes sp. CA-142083]|uniref:precorrin-3B synthase n=1 Tax=Actinoplanes sp. CA-142083 TaxID=3239903 RepID=UPI003D9448BE